MGCKKKGEKKAEILNRITLDLIEVRSYFGPPSVHYSDKQPSKGPKLLGVGRHAGEQLGTFKNLRRTLLLEVNKQKKEKKKELLCGSDRQRGRVIDGVFKG